MLKSKSIMILGSVIGKAIIAMMVFEDDITGKGLIMVKIVEYIEVEGVIFFFAENAKEGMSVDYVKALLDHKLTNLNQKQFEEIVKQVA